VPTATITDEDIAAALLRVAQVVDPLLDVYAEADPVGLRDRTTASTGGCIGWGRSTH
jgi:hypothetical protein